MRHREAVSGSSPTKAGAPARLPAGPPPPDSRYASRIGCTGTPASNADWNAARRNGPWARPHQVDPSGKTVTRSPASSAPVRVATVSGRALIRSRSMNRVPARAASRPSTGQAPISLLASIRQGSTAATSGMSSQEMWLATISRPPAAPGLPCTVIRMPREATSAADQPRTRACRGRSGSSRTGAAVRTARRTRATAPARRSTACGTLAVGPSWPAQASGVQGAVGSQAFMRPGRARGSG